MSPPSRLDPSLVNFALEPGLSFTEFQDVLVRSTLGERRPIDDAARLEGMLRHADVIVTARNRQDTLIGIARAITDFHYCTYLSDLAVDVAYQKQGIGQELIRRCHEAAGRGTTLILLAAPAARDYYPHIGLERHDSCWLQRPSMTGEESLELKQNPALNQLAHNTQRYDSVLSNQAEFGETDPSVGPGME